MTTDKQRAANRRNARKSTGPKTEQGRAIARLNAVRHGTLATTPVVPRLERPEEWQAHLGATLESLNPMGYLEAVLAGRIALLLWRLGRVARYEREAIGLGQEAAEEDLADERGRAYPKPLGPARPAELREALGAARERAARLARFGDLPDEAPVGGGQAAEVLGVVGAYVRGFDPETFAMPAVVPEEVPWEEYQGWTAGLVRRGIAAIAAKGGIDPDLLREAALFTAREEAEQLEAEADRVADRLDRLRRERLLPDAAELDKLTRYEAHLGRQLDRTLHELRRLQAARSDAGVAPPAVLDLTVSGGE